MFASTLLAISICCNTVVAENTGNDTKIREAVMQFNRFINEKDYETAEIIALGAAAKYGEERPIIAAMLSKFKDGKNTSEQQTRNTHLSTARTVRSYSMDDLPIWSKDGKSANSILLENYLKVMIGERAFSKLKIIPYAQKGSLVIEGREIDHAEIRSIFKELPTP